MGAGNKAGLLKQRAARTDKRSGAALPPAARQRSNRGRVEKGMSERREIEPEESGPPRKTELDNVLSGQVDALAATGYPVTLEPDTIEMMGASAEEALTGEEAFESRFDDEIPTKGENNE